MPLAYICAVIAAAALIAVSAVGAVGAPDPAFASILIAPFVATVFYVGTAAFVPAAVAIVVAEVARLRSVFYYLLAGGAIGAAANGLARFADMVVILGARPIAYLAAGFVGGFVYWVIAVAPAAATQPQQPQSDGR